MGSKLRHKLLGAGLLALVITACNTSAPEDQGPKPPPPEPVIKADPPSGAAAAPVTVTFEAGALEPPAANYEWFVAGTQVGTAATLTYEFVTGAPYLVRLEVTDAHGQTGSAEISYVVLPTLADGSDHTLTPADFAGYEVAIEPTGHWTASTDTAWLSVSPEAGTGGPATLTLTVEPTELPPNTNVATATLTLTQDHTSLGYAVAALLPELQAPSWIGQRSAALNSETRVSFEVVNAGASSLEVTLELQGGGGAEVTLAGAGGGATLEPGQRQAFELAVVCPAHPAEYAGQITITTNDPRNPVRTVPVTVACSDTEHNNEYQINLVFQAGEFTSEQQAIIRQAAERWQRVVVGAIANHDPNDTYIRDFCFRWLTSESVEGPIAPELEGISSFEGLLVFVRTVPHQDGALARAGPCGYQDRLPNFGSVMFSADQLERMTSMGWLPDVTLHELGHVLGLGTVWRQDDSELVWPGTYHCAHPSHEPHFTRVFVGATGVLEYHRLGGTAEPALEPDCSHWHETRFGAELMTPILNTDAEGVSVNPLSDMTVGALEDLGYAVNYAEADSYSLTLTSYGHPPELGNAQPRHAEPISMFVSPP